MLSVQQFKRLSLIKKHYLLNKEGIDLSAIFTRKESRILFSLYGFYVEVIFMRTSSEIKSLTCFTDLEKLEPYLEHINIDDLTILLSSK